MLSCTYLNDLYISITVRLLAPDRSRTLKKTQNSIEPTIQIDPPTCYPTCDKIDRIDRRLRPIKREPNSSNVMG